MNVAGGKFIYNNNTTAYTGNVAVSGTLGGSGKITGQISGGGLVGQAGGQEAEEFARRAFDDQLRNLGPHHQDTLESLRILGEALTRTGRYEEAKKTYTDTIARIGADSRYTAREGVVDLWYGLASLAVRVGRRDEAFNCLEHAVDAGYDNAPFLRTDDALKPLHSDPRFDKLLARATAASRQRPS